MTTTTMTTPKIDDPPMEATEAAGTALWAVGNAAGLLNADEVGDAIAAGDLPRLRILHAALGQIIAGWEFLGMEGR